MANPVHIDDKELWNALNKGDEPAFGRLMERYFKRLVNYGHKFSGDQAFIKDCVQELFVELWRYRLKLAPTDSVKAYLFVSLRRRIARRSQQNRIFGKATELADEPSFLIDFDVQTALIESESERLQIEQLNRCINALPVRQKEVIYLKFYQNLSHAEIASVLAIQTQTAANLVHRAIVALRASGLTDMTYLLVLLLKIQ